MLNQSQSILDSSLLSLKLAAPIVKTYLEEKNGEVYALVDVERLLVNWFVQSCDQLALEVAYHAVTGDRTYAFNRDGFNRMAAKLPAVHQSEAIAA